MTRSNAGRYSREGNDSANCPRIFVCCVIEIAAVSTRRSILTGWVIVLSVIWTSSGAETVSVRVAASNLTSGRYQTYALAGEPEGAGARILQFLKPDIVLMQEFNTEVATADWVRDTFGEGFEFSREEGEGIPNGIISRFPIVESGEWEDETQTNRDFAWAKIALPNGRILWAVSVHLYSQRSTVRVEEAEEIVRRVLADIPEEDLVILGGDFNTTAPNSPAVEVLGKVFAVDGPQPVDQAGDGDTNASRAKPYDWVVPEKEMAGLEVAVEVGGNEFPNGLVFDSRVFEPIGSPVRRDDSERFQMQHMGVIREYAIPGVGERTEEIPD